MFARISSATGSKPAAPLRPARRRRLGQLLVAATAALLGLTVFGVITERQARTPLVRVGQAAPEWQLPAADGGVEALANWRGHTLVLLFVPSVHCPSCRAQLLALQAALPELHRRGGQAFAISTDLASVQRSLGRQLGLGYPLLSETPAYGLHPVGSAYGLYHRDNGMAGPVDAQALIVVGGDGIVRAVVEQPGGALDAARIVALVEAAQ